MPENRRFVVVALDLLEATPGGFLKRKPDDLTADLNRQLDAMAPAAELHFIQALAVGSERALMFFRQYDEKRRDGRKGRQP